MSVSRTSSVSSATVLITAATALSFTAVAAPAAAQTMPAAPHRLVLLSANAAAEPGNQPTRDASVTPDGRIVVFESYASNLVPGDDNGQRDIFLRDRRTGAIELISVSRTGAPANGESQLSVTAVSADGRFVTFRSTATDLVRGVDRNGGDADVYVRDRVTRSTVRISGGLPLTHNERPAISGDGRFVAFVADDSRLVSGDTNLVPDVFVYDRASATTRRASVGRRGAQSNNLSSAPVLNGNGRYVAFLSFATNLDRRSTQPGPQAFVRDLRSGVTERVSYGLAGDTLPDGIRQGPSISSDGRLVAFPAYDGQVYLRDRSRRVTTLVSATPAGVPGNQFSHTPRLSPDGRSVTFVSSATDLAPPHPSMTSIHRRDLAAATTQRLRPHTVDGARLLGGDYLYTASNAGVVFMTPAGNLGAGYDPDPDTLHVDQLYLADW